jgi:hypothetical protein
MNISFRSLSSAAFLVAAMMVASCSPTGPASTPNDLAIEQNIFQLSNQNLADTTGVTLVCGCPYHLSVDKFEGDTTMITYSIPTFTQANGQAVDRFTVIVQGVPTAPSGTYSARLALRGGGENYKDTVFVTYIVP